MTFGSIKGEQVMTEKMKIAIVDDEWIIREGIKKLVDWEKQHCMVVGEAADGLEAINLVESAKPDILIIDINLPILSGLDVIRKLKEKKSDIIIIIISGYDDFYYCQEALRLNVTEYLLKPIDYKELEAIIKRIQINKLQNGISGKKTEVVEISLIQKITGYIRENYKTEINLEKLSEEFHVSSSYISKRFKQDTGMNYFEYLTWIRIEKAKEILLNSEHQVTEIASEIGFKDYRIFIKSFKDKTGMTPKEFRKKYESKNQKDKHFKRD